VREAVFNALFSLDDVVRGARVLDLFAGSGALGIEALSRGATWATFVEKDPRAAAVLRANLVACGVGARAEVVGRDVGTVLAAAPGTGYDVAFADPPYAFDDWPALLERVPAALVVIESDREIDPGPAWDVVRVKRYGSTVVGIVRRRDAALSPE
jgi:16S rRNA (guanine966-N2)-methyltransferase